VAIIAGKASLEKKEKRIEAIIEKGGDKNDAARVSGIRSVSAFAGAIKTRAADDIKEKKFLFAK